MGKSLRDILDGDALERLGWDGLHFDTADRKTGHIWRDTDGEMLLMVNLETRWRELDMISARCVLIHLGAYNFSGSLLDLDAEQGAVGTDKHSNQPVEA